MRVGLGHAVYWAGSKRQRAGGHWVLTSIYLPRLMPVESLGALEHLPGALQWGIPTALERGRGPPWRGLPGAMGSD